MMTLLKNRIGATPDSSLRDFESKYSKYDGDGLTI
jgi:hypothetical protein